MQIERMGAVNSPVTRRWPAIHGGACERHGTVDPLKPATEQYLLCGCFSQIGEIRCSYCPENKDPREVIRISNINVAASPADPNTIIAWCDSYECSRKHNERFKVNV